MIEILTQFGLAIAAALAPILVGLLAALAAKGVKYLTAKIDSAYVSGVLERLNSSAWDIVQSLSQTMADQMRAAAADGKLTDDEQKAIKDAAIAKLKSYIGPAGIQELMSVLGLSGGQLDEYLGDKVEGAVRTMKARDAGSIRVPIVHPQP